MSYGTVTSSEALLGDHHNEPADNKNEENPFPPEPANHYELPESIYSAAIIMPLSLTEFDMIGRCSVYLQYLGLFINILIQVCLLIYIGDTVADAECVQDGDLPDIALGMCLTIFVASLLADLKESWNMYGFIRNIKTEVSHTPLRLKKDGNDKKYATGMTFMHKCVAVIFVIIPKAAICLVLFVYGGDYLIRSPGIEDLILNTLALGFVIEIDEFLYKLVTPVYLQEVIEDLPNLEISAKESVKQGAWGYIGKWLQDKGCIADQHNFIRFKVNVATPILFASLLGSITVAIYYASDCVEIPDFVSGDDAASSSGN